MSSRWPHGVITVELDELESELAHPDTNEFEVRCAAIEKKTTSIDELDYITLLKLERWLTLGGSNDLDPLTYKDFLDRHRDNPRVILTYIRTLLLANNIKVAREVLSQYTPEIFPRDDYAFVQSLFYLREQKELEWLEATKETLRINPLHRNALISITTQELRLTFSIGAIGYLAQYLSLDPLDTPIRGLYIQLLRKHNIADIANEEELLMNFLNPSESSPGSTQKEQHT